MQLNQFKLQISFNSAEPELLVNLHIRYYAVELVFLFKLQISFNSAEPELLVYLHISFYAVEPV